MRVLKAVHRHSDPRTVFQIDFYGTSRGVVVSPDLAARDQPHRKIAVITMTSQNTPDFVREDFSNFVDEIVALGRGAQNVSLAKRAVVEIANRNTPFDDPRYRIAVKKMGPVPVFELQGIEVQLPDGTRLSLAVFPLLPSRPLDPDKEGPAADILSSLVVIDSALMFRWYCENLFTSLHDMGDHLSPVASMSRLTGIRETLSLSLEGKLAIVIPSQDSWTLFRRGKLERQPSELVPCQWFSDNVQVACEVLYLVCVARQCVQEYVALLTRSLPENAPLIFRGRDLKIREIEYNADNCLAKLIEAYNLQGDIAVTPVIEDVQKIRSVRSSGGLAGLRASDTSTDVGSRLCDYYIFIETTRQELRRIFDPHSPWSDSIRFLSRREQSDFGRHVLELLEAAAMASVTGDGCTTTFIGSGGEELRDSVRAQLWLADDVVCALPPNSEGGADRVGWLYLESEQTALIEKPLVFAVDDIKQLPSSRVLFEALDLADPDLEPIARWSQAGREALRKSVVGRLKSDVVIEVGKASGSAITNFVDASPNSPTATRRRTFLFAYLLLFPRRDIEALSDIETWFGRDPFKSSQYAQFAARKSRSPAGVGEGAYPERAVVNRLSRRFGRLAKRAADLQLSFGGRNHSALEKTRNRRYALGLTGIARSLGGGGSEQWKALQEDVREALSAAIAQVSASPL
jgi:hypothetical protein